MSGIMGLNVGMEYFEDEEYNNGLLIDLFIIRIVVFFTPQD